MLGIFQGLGAKNPLGGIAGLLGGGAGFTGMLDNALYTQMGKAKGKENLLGQLLLGSPLGGSPASKALMPIFMSSGSSSSGLAQDMLMPNQGRML